MISSEFETGSIEISGMCCTFSGYQKCCKNMMKGRRIERIVFETAVSAGFLSPAAGSSSDLYVPAMTTGSSIVL